MCILYILCQEEVFFDGAFESIHCVCLFSWHAFFFLTYVSNDWLFQQQWFIRYDTWKTKNVWRHEIKKKRCVRSITWRNLCHLVHNLQSFIRIIEWWVVNQCLLWENFTRACSIQLWFNSTWFIHISFFTLLLSKFGYHYLCGSHAHKDTNWGPRRR